METVVEVKKPTESITPATYVHDENFPELYPKNSQRWIRFFGTLVQFGKGPKVKFADDVKYFLNFIISKYVKEFYYTDYFKNNKLRNDSTDFAGKVFRQIKTDSINYSMARIVTVACCMHVDEIYDKCPATSKNYFKDTLNNDLYEKFKPFDRLVIFEFLNNYLTYLAYKLSKICKSGDTITIGHIKSVIELINTDYDSYTNDNDLVLYGDKPCGMYDGFFEDADRYVADCVANT